MFNNKRNKFQLFNVNKDVVKKTRNMNRASGMDQITAKLLKEAADVSAYSLSVIINLSVHLFIFSEGCKIAKLKPLFKKAKNYITPKNYRPI